MDDSLLPALLSSDGYSSSTLDPKGVKPTVSANGEIPRARPLAAPPRDVTRLLDRHGTSLPRYLDAQRWRDIGHSHQRWPLLWGRVPLAPGGRS